MKGTNIYLKLVPKRRQVVAKSGKVGLFENVFLLENVTEDEADLEADAKALLPAEIREDYVHLKEASKRTGLSNKKIRVLSEEKKIKVKRFGAEWYISLESLNRFLKDQIGAEKPEDAEEPPLEF